MTTGIILTFDHDAELFVVFNLIMAENSSIEENSKKYIFEFFHVTQMRKVVSGRNLQGIVGRKVPVYSEELRPFTFSFYAKVDKTVRHN
jgi:hypothetical protein